MVEASPQRTNLTIGNLENMTEAELEAIITGNNSDDARFVLGRL